MGDLVSEVSFGSLLHLGQNHSGDFLGGLSDTSCRQLEKVDRQWKRRTYESLEVVPVPNPDDRLRFDINDLERPMKIGNTDQSINGLPSL